MAKPARNSVGLDAYFEHYYFQVNEQCNEIMFIYHIEQQKNCVTFYLRYFASLKNLRHFLFKCLHNFCSF